MSTAADGRAMRRASYRAGDRVEGLDVARALAILAMVLINFQVFLLAPPDGLGADLVPAWLIHLPSGRSSSLFVTLAGAGASLMARCPDRWRVQKTLLKRSLFLLVAGNLLILVWSIDILHFYAFYLAIAALLFLRFRDRELLGAAVVIALFSALLNVAFDWGDHDYHSLAGMPLDVLVDGIHPLFPWLSFVAVGVWVGRRDLRDPGVRRRVMLGGALLAASTELLSVGLSGLVARTGGPTWIAGQLGTSWSPEVLYVASASGTALFVIGASQELVSRFGDRLPVRMLIATGQLSLTIYILHALVGVGVPRWAMGLEEALPWGTVTLWWATFCALVVPLAYLWRRRFRRGPLELGMRAICGQTPPAAPRGAVLETRSPPRWPWAFVGLAAVGLLAVRTFGLLSPRWGCGPTRALDGRVVGELTLTCGRQRFALEVPTPSEARLGTDSSVDLYLELYDGDEQIDEDDDGGEGLNPLLSRPLEAGRYEVLIRPYYRGLGPYSLEATLTPAPR